MNLKAFLYLSFLMPIFSSCQTEKKLSEYPRFIGDIAFDSKYDKSNFYLCNEKDIAQYHNDSKGMEYKGEKIALQEEIFSKFKAMIDTSQNGLIRIRFIVNCKGETDRFRIISMDENYNEKKFSINITEQLLLICKELKGWLPKKLDGKEVDYYQYLIFKINRGNLIEILP